MNDIAVQNAIWNCVYYNMQTYQLSILRDMHHIIAGAQAKVDPRPVIGGAATIEHSLKNAVKKMNTNLVQKRASRTPMVYNTVVMSRLIRTQNALINAELETLGINISQLAPYVNVALELGKRADAAYAAVKERVSRAKQVAAFETATTSPAVKGAVGTGVAQEEQKPEAAAPPLAPALSIPSIGPAAATANPTWLPAAVALAPRVQPPATTPAPGSISATIPLAPALAYMAASAEAAAAAAGTEVARGVKTPAHAHAYAHTPAHEVQVTPAKMPAYGATPAAHTWAPEAVALAPRVQPPATTPAPGSISASTPLAFSPAYMAASAEAAAAAAGTEVARGVKTPAHAHAYAHTPAHEVQVTPAKMPAYGATPAAHTSAPEAVALAPRVQPPARTPAPGSISASTPLAFSPAYMAASAEAATAAAGTEVARGVKTPAHAHAYVHTPAHEVQVTPAKMPAYGATPAAHTSAPELPPDNLEITKREVEPVPGLHVPSAEEQLLGNAPALTAAEEQMGKPWFATHVVNHRHAWCCLRDAAERDGMRQVLKERPWANPEDYSDGANQAVGSDVLQLMSLSAQLYLKDLMMSLKSIAWQRNGGATADMLAGVESRLENFTDDTNSCQDELRRGLVPRLPPVSDMPRVLLKKEEQSHRNECQEREERWEAELKDKLKAAEELRKRLIRRGQRKLPTGGYKWWEDMEATAKSGWLSQEQQATSEFTRRVAVKHGIGVAASLLKRKQDQANKHQTRRRGGASGAASAGPDLEPEAVGASTQFPDVSMEDLGAAASSVGGNKRSLDPYQDESPIDVVRNIRRRLTCKPAADLSGPEGMESGAEAPGGRSAKKIQINNTHLVDLLRSTKPRGDRRGCAKILFRAQNGRRGRTPRELPPARSNKVTRASLLFA